MIRNCNLIGGCVEVEAVVVGVVYICLSVKEIICKRVCAV